MDYSLNLVGNLQLHSFSMPCSAIKLNNENSSIHIDAVIDPLSPTGQKLAPLLCILWKQIQPSMRIVLNPIVCNLILLSLLFYIKVDSDLCFCVV